MNKRAVIVRITGAIVGAVLLAGFAGIELATPAAAVHVPQSVVVSADPANWTPHVLDGEVNAIAQVGNTVYLGGQFTRVRSATSSTEIARTNFLAFDATNGTISPLNPRFDGTITTIEAAADGQSLYIGGSFNSVNGQSIRKLVRLATATATPVAGFTTPTINGTVKDLRLVGNRLWVAGTFTHVGGFAQAALATINATTGARDPYMGLSITGTHNGGTTQVLKIDVTPNGNRLFAIGNFTAVDGQFNDQAVALSLTGSSAALADWHTNFYTSTCSNSFNTFMRDLDISPDGTYVVISTTGAYSGGPPRSCDTHARFEVGASGNDVRPTWVNYTGGDTSYAVAVTGTAVYVGGHFRWANNPFAADRAGAGAVSRPGLVALDPQTGLPLSWNPTRTLGVGVFDLVSTPAGLWVASDTDRIGDFEFHGRIAFFPVQGGTAVPPNNAGHLPGRAFILDPATANNAVVARDFDGDDAGPAQSIPNGGINWDLVRGAVMIDDTVYAGFGDTAGSFVARSFDGSSWGPADPVNTADQLVVDSAWHSDVRNLTGMFYDGGRLYYTVSGQRNLFYRWFLPESQVVGAQRFTASGNVTGIDFSTVRSMFAADGWLYWATSDGVLRRIQFDGAPVAGTAQVVSGPGVDGVDWRGRAIFLDAHVVVPNQPPVAVADVSCSGLGCAADGTASSDPDGTVASWSWDFGDGTAPVSGATAQHTYDTAGTYTVTLTVTDDDGAPATATRSVTVAPVSSDVGFVGAANVNANATSFQVTLPAGVQEGDGLLLFATTNSPTAALSAPTGGGNWTLVDTVQGSSVLTSLWQASAAAGAGGTPVRLTSAAIAKVDVTVLAYHGTASTPVAAFASAVESTSRTTHTTPFVTAAGGAQWAVAYVAHKDSTSTSLSASGIVTRSTGAGTGGGRVLSVAGDSGGPVPPGSAGGITATAQGASAQATMWTVLLAPK